MLEKLTMDRAARRYSQIAALEHEVNLIEAQITEATGHVTDARKVVDELREKKSTLLADMRKAARDEGELPLFTFLD